MSASTNLASYPEIFRSEQLYGVKGSTKFHPVFIFSYSRFREIMMGNLDRVSSDFEKLTRFVVSEMEFGKPDYRVENTYQNEFTFVIHPQSFLDSQVKYRLVIWNSATYLPMVDAFIPLNIGDREIFFNNVLAELDLYHRGFVHCNFCGELITVEDAMKHKLISKILCDHCWQEDQDCKDQRENAL